LPDIAALTTAQVKSLTTDQIRGLTDEQINAIELADIAILTTNQVRALTDSQIIALNTDQIMVITTNDLNALTTHQIQVIENQDIAALTIPQITKLSTANVNALTVDQVASLTLDQFVNLSTNQIQAFTPTQIQALTGDQVIALTTAQAYAMTTADIRALTEVQIAVMENSDLAAINAAGHNTAFTQTQIDAMSIDQQMAAVLISSPIVLDLNGDGVQTTSAAQGVNFDLTASGQKNKVGWVSPTDGLLVRDINHDGMINDGSELFGTATRLASGEIAKDGFAALRDLDSNSDGVLDAKDAAFKDLQIWVDSNLDGITQAGELKSLDVLGITQFNLDATATAIKNNGNWELLDSTFTTTDGTQHLMADIWFQTTVPADIAEISTIQAETLTNPVMNAGQMAASLNSVLGLSAAPLSSEFAGMGMDSYQLASLQQQQVAGGFLPDDQQQRTGSILGQNQTVPLGGMLPIGKIDLP
jgi:hypothetical protein